MPGQPATPPLATATPRSPVAAQINAKEVEYGTNAQKLLALDPERSRTRSDRLLAETKLQQTQLEQEAAQAVVADAASEDYQGAAALPPGEFGSPFHQLEQLLGMQRGDGDSMSAALHRVAQAQNAVRIADAAYRAALTREQGVSTEYEATQAEYRRLEADLQRMRQENATALAGLEQEEEAREQALAPASVGSGSVDGKAAHPDALKAVRFAMAQRGDPYVWAAEGPDSYDCSGLMWAAYRSVGRTLPRVSRDQYYGTRTQLVDRDSLLPGDLVFFSSTSSWQDIYHVGMYIGDGKMVYAPTFGDVVKVGSVRWSRYFAATRVIGAVDGPAQPTATPKPVPSVSPSRTPRPSATPKPAPSMTPSKPRPSSSSTRTTPPSSPSSPTSPSVRPSTSPNSSVTATASALPPPSRS